MTFETFNTRGKGILQAALATARQIVSGDTEIKFLTLAGNVDQGKTHLAISVVRAWLAKRKPARFCDCDLMLNELRQGFNLEGEESYARQFDRLCKTPLLVLDDVGMRPPTSWGLDQLQMLIQYRTLHSLSLVVTTNNPLASIVGNKDDEHALASSRIASRLQRESYCRVIILDGQESRTWRL